MKKKIFTLFGWLFYLSAYGQCPVVEVEPDHSICPGSRDTLNAIITGEVENLEWATNGSGNFSTNNSNVTIYTPSNRDIAAGTVTITLDANNGPNSCNIQDQVVLTFKNRPAVSAGEDMIICSGDSITLSGSQVPEGGSGRWTRLGTGTPNLVIRENSNPSSVVANTQVVLGNTQPTVNLRWQVQDASGCTNSDTVSLQVRRRYNANADVDQVICPGNNGEVELSGNNPPGTGSGLWSFVPGTETNATFSDPSQPGATVSGLQAGELLTLLWTVTNAPCAASTDTMTITVAPGDVVNVNAGEDITICAGDSVLLKAAPLTEGVQGQWTRLGTGLPNVRFSNVNSPSSYLLNTTLGNGNTEPAILLRWTVSNEAGCSESDTMQITIRRIPNANAGINQLLCLGSGSEVALNGNDPSGAATGSWTFATASLGSGTLTDPKDPNSTITGITEPGTLALVWKIENAPCPTDQDTVFINAVNSSALTVNAGEDVIICSGDSVTLQGSPVPPGGNGNWNRIGFGNPNITILNEETPSAMVRNTSLGVGNTQPTLPLAWTVSDSNGCAKSDTMTIQVRRIAAADAGPDQIICAGNTSVATLNGNVAYETAIGTWSFYEGNTTSAIITSPGNPTSTVSSLPSTGTIHFIWSVTNGPCPIDKDTVALQMINSSITASDAGADQIICAGTSVTLNANTPEGTATGRWARIGSGAPNIFIADAENPATSVNNTGLGGGTNQPTLALVWTITDTTGCISRDTVNILIKRIPNANAGPDMVACSSDNIFLNANFQTSIGSGVWTYRNGISNIFEDPNAADTKLINVPEDDTLTLVWTVTNAPCAADSDSVRVIINTPPTAALITQPAEGPNASFTICIGDTMALVGSEASSGTSSWSRLSGDQQVAIINGNFNLPVNNDTAMVVGTASGTAIFQYRIANGNNGNCASFDTLTLTVRENCIGTGISSKDKNTNVFMVQPNHGSGIFLLSSNTAEVETYDISVFSQNGTLLYTFRNEISSSALPIDLSYYKQGLYLIKIADMDHSETFKVTIE